MKVVVVLIVLLGLGLGYFLLNGSNQAPITEVQIQPAPEVDSEESAVGQSIAPQTSLEVPPSDQEKVQQNAEKLQIAKQKLESLLQEYNDNLSDPDKRKEIQDKVDQLMKEYNELVLPAALAKIE